MVSLKLRRIFYSAAIVADKYNQKRKSKLEKIEDLEKQLILAKKIMSSLEEKKEGDPAMLIRLEGKLRRIDGIIKVQKEMY